VSASSRCWSASRRPTAEASFPRSASVCSPISGPHQGQEQEKNPSSQSPNRDRASCPAPYPARSLGRPLLSGGVRRASPFPFQAGCPCGEAIRERNLALLKHPVHPVPQPQRERNLRFLSLWKPFLPSDPLRSPSAVHHGDGRRAGRAHEALPHTPPGGLAPLRPPAAIPHRLGSLPWFKANSSKHR